METTAVQTIKLAIVAATGLSKDALHIYVGLAAFLIAAVVSKRPLSSLRPWGVVLLVATAGEFVDMRDDFSSFGCWRWSASLHDILNTIAWPTVFLVLARNTRIFDAREK